jgi:hypothetical protein
MDFYLNDTINWLLSSVDVEQFSPKLYTDVNEKETTSISQDSTSQYSTENEEGNERSEEEYDRRHNPNVWNVALTIHHQLKIIALEILEDNALAMMNYDKKWPIMDIAALHIVEVLYITVMSNVMGLKNPFPLFPIINKASKGYFGWEGSKGFVAAAE